MDSDITSSQRPAATPRKRRPTPRQVTTRIVLGLLLLAAFGGGLFWFMKYRQALANNPTVERDRLVARISQHVQLPADQPIILNVVDKTKLSNPNLTQNVENGDKLLIYSATKRLIVYRPGNHKVIDMLTIQDTKNLLKPWLP